MKKIKLLGIILLILILFVMELNSALPLRADITTMDYAFQGQPFIELPSKDSIDLTTMDYAFQGQPFVRLYEIVVAGWSHKWNTATISKWNNTTFSKWNGIDGGGGGGGGGEGWFINFPNDWFVIK